MQAIIAKLLGDPKKTIPVMFNGSYGGFGFSQEAVDEYNKRRGPLGEGQSPLLMSHSDSLERTDPLMAQICEDLGPSESSGRYSEIHVERVPARYANCIVINEYDGSESVSVSFRKYQLDCIRLILSSDTVTSEEKLRLIALVTSEETELSHNLDREPLMDLVDSDPPAAGVQAPAPAPAVEELRENYRSRSWASWKDGAAAQAAAARELEGPFDIEDV